MDSETRKLIERDSREAFCFGLKERYACKKSDNKKIFAENAIKAIGPFYCPECYSDAIVRKDRGSGRIDHFAHIAAKSKLFSNGETELHKNCKAEICNSLAELFPDGHWATERPIPANIEKDFPGLIPDISGRITRLDDNGKIEHVPVIIEIQRSFLQIPIISKRTIAYTSRVPPVYILWIVPLREPLLEEPFRPCLFERFLHSMYYGRIYYWWAGMGSNVMPVHFGRTKRYIEVSNWIKDGEEQTGGGFDKLYKTIKVPVFGKEINIGKDFKRSFEVQFDPYKHREGSKHYTIPNRNIFRDDMRAWWSKESEYIKEEDFFKEDEREFRYYIDDYSDSYDDEDVFPDDFEDEQQYQEGNDEYVVTKRHMRNKKEPPSYD